MDPVLIQNALLRFAGGFATSMALDINKLRLGTNAPDPAEVLKWKIEFVTETCSIASGPNPLAALLDMTVFVTVTRAAVEEHWEPQVYGESAQPLLADCRNAETNIWKIAGGVLTQEQQAQLRRAIESWRRRNPLPDHALAARALGIATEVVKSDQAQTAASTGLFDMLKLDPLSGLDPATREIAQMRLLAERGLYVTQTLPVLLRWQAEMLTLRTVELPPVQQLVANTTALTASVDRFARVAEQLPAQVSNEREEIVKALQSQEKNLTPLVNEVRQTLAAGSQMSTSLNTTITTFDGLMKRFGVGETNNAGPPDTNSPPFRIQEYGQAAVQFASMARQLTDLVRALDQTLDSTNLSRLSAQVSPAVQQAQIGGKELVDYAFWRGTILLALALAAALVYRFLALRMKAASSRSHSL